jgi:RND superfamily putative drug exporter
MGLPIGTALFGIATGSALVGITTRFLSVPQFTPLVAAMIGIGVGIDYSLLIVTRYRQALHDGMEPREAVGLAIDTSGRAVLFAGTVVVISLLGIFTMNLDFMRSMAIGAVLAVLMTMLSALTLLPALLGFVGKNIDKFGLPHRKAAEGDITRSFWYKWSRVIQHHPWPALVLSTTALLVMALPAFWLDLGFSDNGLRKETQSPRRAYDMLADGFGPGFNGPILVVADTPSGASDTANLNKFRDAIAATPGVASVTPAFAPPQANGAIQMFQVFPTTGPREQATKDLVHRIRTEVRPSALPEGSTKAYLAGLPAGVVDFADFQAAKLPIFIGAVLILSFLLLMTVFHSVVVPLKAVIMNMLSIGASFGLTVAVFQWGIGSSLLGLGENGPFEAWAPMFLFSILFGLSMDYEVFLLTRVREEYDRTGDNGRAVADGLAATGRVISAAAAIMVCVFAAFILGEDRSIKLMGFGLASAILIDATLVRLILVPSAMELLGDRNWWAPDWLVKRLPTIRVDTVEQPHAEPAAAMFRQ